MKQSLFILFTFMVAACFLHLTESRSLKYIKSDNPNCDIKRQLRIDQVYSKLVSLGKNGRKFPENPKQLKKFCNETSAYEEELTKFLEECLEDDLKNVAKIAIYSLRRTLKSYCGKKTKKVTTLLKATPCVNPILPKDECLAEMSNKTRNLIPYKIENQKIFHLCCYNVDMINCLENSMSELSCITDEGKNAIIDMVKSISADLTNFACGDYTEESDKCTTLSPLNKKDYDPKQKMDKKLKSLLFAMLYMVESIEKFSVGS